MLKGRNTVLDEQGIGWIVQIRRGGQAREDALRKFESATREDGRPAISWLIEDMASKSSGGLLDSEEVRQAARRGFVRAPDTFCYKPGRAFTNSLSAYVRMCINSEITDLARAAGRKRNIPTEPLELVGVEPSIPPETQDAKLTISLLIDQLEDDEREIAQRYLDDPDSFGPLEFESLCQMLRDVLLHDE